MHLLDWIVTLFDLEIENVDIESRLDELADMCVDLEGKSLFRSKNLSDNWSNVNTVTKYSNFRHFYLHSQVCTWLKLVLAM